MGLDNGLHVHEEAASLFVRHMKFDLTLLSELLSSALLGVEVVLASLASQNLAGFGDLEALAIRFVGLHSHIFGRCPRGARLYILRI